MLAKIVQPKGPGRRNQQAKHTVAGRQRADLPGEFAVDADSDEVAQCAVRADDAQGPKAGMQQPAGGLDHPFQDGIQAQILRQGHDRLEQARHAFLGLEELFRPGGDPLEYFVDPGIVLGDGMA